MHAGHFWRFLSWCQRESFLCPDIVSSKPSCNFWLLELCVIFGGDALLHYFFEKDLRQELNILLYFSKHHQKIFNSSLTFTEMFSNMPAKVHLSVYL